MIAARKARPFLKWAGGKGRQLPQLDRFLPRALKAGHIERYVEPFIGGGALFFYVAQRYPVGSFVIADVNRELVLVYRALQRDVQAVIGYLMKLAGRYETLDETERRSFYYRLRDELNQQSGLIDYNGVEPQRAAQLIYLNRTCYNGLFRVNSRGEFNVPFGDYKNPTICATDNLLAVSQILQRAEIVCGSFQRCEQYVDESSFVYFDPPYRPLNATSNFTAYSQYIFDDAEQLRLAESFRNLDRRGARLMLSNSDPHNVDATDSFFEDAYAGFRLERVKATRRINSRADRRGEINELLILNY